MSKKDKTLKGIKTPSRRKFFKAAAATGAVAAVAASNLAAPAVAAERIELAMVTTWPRDFPGLGTGAQRFAKRQVRIVLMIKIVLIVIIPRFHRQLKLIRGI